DPGRSGRTGPRVAEGARPTREARVLSPHRGALRALPQPNRPAHLASVVVLDGGATEAGARGPSLPPRPLPPGVAAPVRDPVARGRAGLEHLPPDLVGPSAAGVGVSVRTHHGPGDRARRVRPVPLGRVDALHRSPR